MWWCNLLLAFLWPAQVVLALWSLQAPALYCIGVVRQVPFIFSNRWSSESLWSRHPKVFRCLEGRPYMFLSPCVLDSAVPSCLQAYISTLKTSKAPCPFWLFSWTLTSHAASLAETYLLGHMLLPSQSTDLCAVSWCTSFSIFWENSRNYLEICISMSAYVWVCVYRHLAALGAARVTCFIKTKWCGSDYLLLLKAVRE